MYGKAKAALIRLGEGMTRLTHGGQALRTVALLPGVTGHYGVEGRRRAAADGRLVRSQLRRRAQAVRPGDGAHGESPAPRRRAPEHEGSADPRAVRRRQQSGRDLPRGAQGAEGPDARGPVHRGARPVHDRHRDATPTSCCRPRAISRPTISTVPTAPTGCSGARRPSSRQGEARSNFDVAQALAQRMGVTDRIFSLTPREAAEEFFKGSTGPASKVDRNEAVRRRADEHQARLGRPALQDAVGQARILFRAARQAGPAADAGLGARSRRGRGGREVAAAPADGARLLPGPRPSRASASCASAKASPSASCIPRTPRSAASRTATGCACSTTAARSA